MITEGLLTYLTDDVVRSLARDFARPSVRAWILDMLSPATRDEVMRQMDETLASAPMLFAPPEGIAFFEALGWRTSDMRSLLEEARRLRRLPWLFRFSLRCRCRRRTRASWRGGNGPRSFASANEPGGLLVVFAPHSVQVARLHVP